jgi:hypothetical protein
MKNKILQTFSCSNSEWKAIWHTVFDFFSELFDEKPWQEKDTKSKLKILGALLLGAILTFIFYIL